MAFDYKKEYKDLYQPKRMPAIVTVPAMRFVAVDGVGDPNEEGGDYAKAMQLLYGISFTIKMNKKSNNPDEHIDGYFDYTVPPLEGLWSMEKGVPGVDYTRKTDFYWTSMIRLPEFVTDEVFAWAKASFASKHPEVDINRAYLFDFMKAWSRRSCTKARTTTSRNRDDSGRLRAFARLRARLLRRPPPSRDLPIRPAPSQTGKSQNHHPSSGSEGGLTFGELLEALTAQ
mgnify:CR=1 FL=1